MKGWFRFRDINNNTEFNALIGEFKLKLPPGSVFLDYLSATGTKKILM